MSSAPVDPPSPIRDHFLADHRRLEALVTRVLDAIEAGDRETIAGLWDEFASGLRAHLEAEEIHLIPLLMQSSERDARALLEEHKHIRARLSELDTEIDLHMVRLNAARAFIDELRAHAHHEDSLLYRRSDSQFPPEERESLFASLAARLKEKLKGV